MIRSLLKLGFILVLGILIYNYFLGSDTEKETSKKIFGETKNLVVSVGKLLKSEKTKFDAGKYDKALEKIGNVYQSIKEKASGIDPDILDKVVKMDKKRKELMDELEDIKSDSTDSDEAKSKKNKLKDELDKLVGETKRIVDELED